MALRIGVVGTVAAAVLGVMGKAGIDADFQFRRTQARLQATNEEMAVLRDQAEELAAELPLNLLDIAKAQEEYGARGNPIESILRDLPAISRAKVAVSADLAELAKHAHVFSTIFGVSVQDALDKMVAIENSSAATAVTMGRALQFSAQTAKEMGVTADEYLALLGGLAGAGVDVSRSSRGLTNFLSRIAKGITDLGEGGPITVEALSAIGISLEELTAIMTSGEGAFLRFLQRLKSVDAGFLAETATALTLGGVSYGSAFQALVENLDDVMKNIEVSANSTGTVVRQVETILGGNYGSVQRTIAQLDLLRHTLAASGATDFIAWLAIGVRELVQFGMALNELTGGGLFVALNIFLALGASLLAFAAVLKIASFTIGIYKSVFLGLTFLKARFGRATLQAAASEKVATAATRENTLVSGINNATLAQQQAGLRMWQASLYASTKVQYDNTLSLEGQRAALQRWQAQLYSSTGANARKTASIIANTVATQANTVVRTAGTVGTAVDTGVTSANTVARTGAATATGIWAKAQWGLNFAMRANPLGMLISGLLIIVPLVGLLYAYWDDIWGVVSKIGSTVGGWLGFGDGADDTPKRTPRGDVTGLLHTLGQPLPVAPAQAVPGYPGSGSAGGTLVEGDTDVVFQPGAIQITPTGDFDAQAMATELMDAVRDETRTRRRAAVDASASRVAR